MGAMSEAIREALQQYLDVDIAADEWDEPPSLVLIVQRSDGTTEFVPVPVGDEGWAAGEPYRVVIATADATRILHERTGWTPFVAGEELLGVALFTEGWGLAQNNPVEVAGVEKWLKRGHRLSEHPLAVEVKLVTAVFADDPPIMLTHARGNVPLPQDDLGEVGGRVPEALRYLFWTFQFLAKEKEK